MRRNPEGEDEWKVQVIPEGAVLFHGTSAAEAFDVPDGPAWFSESRSVAERFSPRYQGPKPRVLEYRVARPARLVVLRSSKEFAEFLDSLDGEEGGYRSSTDAAQIVCESGRFDGWIVPNNYPDGSDILICEPDAHLMRVRSRRPRRQTRSPA